VTSQGMGYDSFVRVWLCYRWLRLCYCLALVEMVQGVRIIFRCEAPAVLRAGQKRRARRLKDNEPTSRNVSTTTSDEERIDNSKDVTAAGACFETSKDESVGSGLVGGVVPECTRRRCGYRQGGSRCVSSLVEPLSLLPPESERKSQQAR
jgi:hypothetical protein